MSVAHKLDQPMQPINAYRALSAAVAQVLGSQEIYDGASVSSIGSFAVLARLIVKRVAAGSVDLTLTAKEARLALIAGGVGAADTGHALDALEFLGVASLDGETYALPALTRAALVELEHFENRVSGWKRRGQTPKDSPSAPAASPSVAQDAPIAEQAPAQQAQKTKSKSIDGAMHVLREGKDDTSSVCPHAIPCTGGKVAYVSEKYLAEIQRLHPRVDALHQLQLAIQWAKDNTERQKTQRGVGRFLNHWFGNASASAMVRAHVIGAQGQRNGFGAGGVAKESTETSVPTEGADDGLGDLFAIGADGEALPTSSIEFDLDAAKELTESVHSTGPDEYSTPLDEGDSVESVTQGAHALAGNDDHDQRSIGLFEADAPTGARAGDDVVDDGLDDFVEPDRVQHDPAPAQSHQGGVSVDADEQPVKPATVMQPARTRMFVPRSRFVSNQSA